MHKSMAALLPCPFCGSRSLEQGDNWSCGQPYVRCGKCGALIEDDNCMEKWNSTAGCYDRVDVKKETL